MIYHAPEGWAVTSAADAELAPTLPKGGREARESGQIVQVGG
jgi:hypothetical protein